MCVTADVRAPSISGWKPKHCSARGVHRKRCPLCRGVIPPSQEQIAAIKMLISLMEDLSVDDPEFETARREVNRFKAEYGEDWDGTKIEYDSDFVSLPDHVAKATIKGDLRIVLRWLGKGNTKGKVNAKLEVGGNTSLLLFAAMNQEHDLMGYLLLNGAEVNALHSSGMSVLTLMGTVTGNHANAVRLLLSWGAELLFMDGKEKDGQERKRACAEISGDGNDALSKVISAELWGRRCEITNAPPKSRDDLVGKMRG